MDFIRDLFTDPTAPKPGKAISPEDLAKVQALMQGEGQTVAIQYYQEVTGCDLRTAMDAVRRMDLEYRAAHPYADESWLPEKCPGCGIVLSNDTVRWVDANTVHCPQCGRAIVYTDDE